MLFATPTKYGAGLTVWGDYFDLKGAHSTISYFFDKSPVEYRLKEYTMALAYDLRHAYQGDRLQKDFGFGQSHTVKYQGVTILWPFFLSQIAIIRQQAAFVPHTQHQQAFLYLLEDCARSALLEYDAKTGQECLNWLELTPTFDKDYLVEYFNYCARQYACETKPGKSRFKTLPTVLRNLHWYSDDYKAFTESLTQAASEKKCSPHTLSDWSDWPEFKC